VAGNANVLIPGNITFIAAAPSNDATLPPVTGGRAMTAYFMPGRRTSAP